MAGCNVYQEQRDGYIGELSGRDQKASKTLEDSAQETKKKQDAKDQRGEPEDSEYALETRRGTHKAWNRLTRT